MYSDDSANAVSVGKTEDINSVAVAIAVALVIVAVARSMVWFIIFLVKSIKVPKQGPVNHEGFRLKRLESTENRHPGFIADLHSNKYAHKSLLFKKE
jgi:hypothetical protein